MSLRPRLHFTPSAGWINDPLALTWRGDRYHLFYQTVPDSVSWKPACHWGTATSIDGLTWEEGPVVLAPDNNEYGCWSGSIARIGNDDVLFYTTVDEGDWSIGKVATARAEDDSWQTFTKDGELSLDSPSEPMVAYRDPFVFRWHDEWRMIIGGGGKDGTARAYQFGSSDGQAWYRMPDMVSRAGAERDPIWTGDVWECPQLIQMGDLWVLIVSVWTQDCPHYVAYSIGTYDGVVFVPQTWRRLTYGSQYYAGSVFADADGDTGIIYWLRNFGDAENGWKGAHSLPHRLTLGGDMVTAYVPKGLGRSPVAEIHAGARMPLAGPSVVIWSPDELNEALSFYGPGLILKVVCQEGGYRIDTFDGEGTDDFIPAAPGHLAEGTVTVVVDNGIIEVFTTGGVFCSVYGSEQELAVGLEGKGRAAIADVAALTETQR